MICTKCDKPKKLTDFYRRNGAIRRPCKQCCKDYDLETRTRNNNHSQIINHNFKNAVIFKRDGTVIHFDSKGIAI